MSFEQQCKCYIKNNDQKTALDFARDNGNFEIVELLENINISNSK